MAQHLLDDFGMHILGEQKGGSRVPQIVEANIWKPHFFKGLVKMPLQISGGKWAYHCWF
jgi:hypothetical protein